ncbi:HAMP domain-containing histidine kinase, partial [bacterium]|nr:HAMP domain-containing histidine kinase [bacterium]
MPKPIRRDFRPKIAQKRWPWGVLLAIVLFVIAGLGTGYNWALVQNYNKMIALAKSKFQSSSIPMDAQPWLNVVFGSLGFLIVIGIFILFFIKVLREMKLNQLQKEFLANVTHELKTPLASLELSSQLIRQGSLKKEEEAALWDAHQSELDRLKGDIDRLLTASRLEQFAETPHLSQLNLETWLQKQIQQWEIFAKNRMEITREGAKLDLDIEVDPKLLDLITRNIVDNAKKFTPLSGARLLIKTELVHSKEPPYDVWTIKFQDNGVGFQSSSTADIFKRFKRLKSTSHIAIPGAGLGMHLALSAARSLSLDLRAESPGPGKGATFILVGKKEYLSSE